MFGSMFASPLVTGFATPLAGDDFNVVGYLELPNQNISTTTLDIGLLQNVGAAITTATAMCNASANCQYFNGGATGADFKHFTPETGTTSYIKTSKCASPATAGGVIPGFFTCTGINAVFTPYVHYVAPPSTAMATCDMVPSCAGFSVDSLFTNAYLYQVAAAPNHTFALKTHTTVADGSSSPSPAEVGAIKYIAMKGVNLAMVPAVTDVFVPSPADPAAYDKTLMTLGNMQAACIATPATCDSVQDVDKGGKWSFYKFARDATVTTYIDPNVCTAAGKFLKCTGKDTSLAPVVGKAYQLPNRIMSEVCEYKNCHFYVQKNDDTGGTLYNFQANPVATASSYILSPSPP